MKKILFLILLLTSCKIINYNTTDDVYYSKPNTPILTKVFVMDINYSPLVFDYSFSYHRHYNPWYYTSFDNYYGYNTYQYSNYHYPFYSNYNMYYNPYRFYNNYHHHNFQNNYTYRYAPRTNYNSNRRTESPKIIQKQNIPNINRYNQPNTHNIPTTYNRTEPIRNVPQNAPVRIPVRTETPKQNYNVPRSNYNQPKQNYNIPRSNYSPPRQNYTVPRTTPSYNAPRTTQSHKR